MSSGILKLAIQEAEQSTYKFKIGAVVFRNKKILGSSRNQIRSVAGLLPKYKTWSNSLHAEQAALLGLDWSKLKGASICVVRVSKSLGLLSNAFPCSTCITLLKYIGIKDVYYSTVYGTIDKYKL